MSTIFNRNRKLERIIRYLSGNIDEQAKRHFERWLDTDTENRRYFDRMKEIWNQLASSYFPDEKTTEVDWKKVLERIQPELLTGTKDYSEERKSHFQLSSIRKIAAIFIFAILLSGSFFLMKRFAEPVSHEENINEIIVPAGQQAQLHLSDGSKVWLNAGTKFRFPAHFDKKKREVWLEGEAFFEVKKNTASIFYVHTSDITIKVVGTSFNVKAYPEEDIIETTLLSGIVKIEPNVPKNKAEKEIILQPNYKAIYYKDKKTEKITEKINKNTSTPGINDMVISKPVKSENDISWKEGKLIFDNETLQVIAKKLERRYGVTIKIADSDLKQYRYTGVLKKISIEQAIKALQLTAHFQYTITDNEIIITSK